MRTLKTVCCTIPKMEGTLRQISWPGHGCLVTTWSSWKVKPGLVAQICHPFPLESKEGELRDLRPAFAA